MHIHVVVLTLNTVRAYSMAVRGQRAATTRERILYATQQLFVDPSSSLTLEQIAAESDASVQTVLRAFGSKQDLLLAAIGTLRATEQRDVRLIKHRGCGHHSATPSSR